MARKHVTTYLVLEAYVTSQSMRKNPVWKSKNGGLVWAYDLLMEWTGECEKVCYRAMERDYCKGYLDYGVSLRAAWLTEKGKIQLEIYRNTNIFKNVI